MKPLLEYLRDSVRGIRTLILFCMVIYVFLSGWHCLSEDIAGPSIVRIDYFYDATKYSLCYDARLSETGDLLIYLLDWIVFSEKKIHFGRIQLFAKMTVIPHAAASSSMKDFRRRIEPETNLWLFT